jgi:hypothetical protein
MVNEDPTDFPFQLQPGFWDAQRYIHHVPQWAHQGVVGLHRIVPPRVSIELVEFAITRLWYDVQTGINDTFQVYRVADQTTFTITILQGWYTIGGQDTVATGAAIEPVLAALLTATVGGAWGVVVYPLLGAFQFQERKIGGLSAQQIISLLFSLPGAVRTLYA